MHNIDIRRLPEDHIITAIKRHFPNLSEKEVSPAEDGRELRAMLPAEKQMELFPTKREIQNILALTLQSSLSPLNFKHFTTHHLLKQRSKDYEDIIGFYYLSGQIDLFYQKRFLWLERLLKKWIKTHELDFKTPIKLSLVFPFEEEFGFKISFKSYLDLANQYYVRVKYLQEKILPKYESFTDKQALNQYINYTDHYLACFNGIRRDDPSDERIIIANPAVAVLAKDNNADQLIEREVLRYVKQPEERDKFARAFEQLKVMQ